MEEGYGGRVRNVGALRHMLEKNNVVNGDDDDRNNEGYSEMYL